MSDKKVNWLAWITVVPAIATAIATWRVMQGNEQAVPYALTAGIVTIFLVWIGDVGVITEVELREQVSKAVTRWQRLRSALIMVKSDLEKDVARKKIIERIDKILWPKNET